MNYKALLKAILLTLGVALFIIIGVCYPIVVIILTSLIILLAVLSISYLYFKLDYDIEDEKTKREDYDDKS